jgi:hypothetical protein
VGATLWLVLTVAGFGLLRAMDHTTHAFLDAVLLRTAAFSFVGAGLVGASGWLGSAASSMVGWMNSAGAQAGAAALGTGAVWVIWAALTISWILTILPETWFAARIPDWLSISGLLLPSLAASIPGPLGELLRQATDSAGTLMIHLASAAVGLR